KSVPLQPSQAPLMRAVQSVHDRVIRGAAETPNESLVSRYAQWRLKNSLAETQRYQLAMRQAHADLLAKSGKKLDQVEHLALQLTSQNTAPEDVIAMYRREGMT